MTYNNNNINHHHHNNNNFLPSPSSSSSSSKNYIIGLVTFVALVALLSVFQFSSANSSPPTTSSNSHENNHNNHQQHIQQNPPSIFSSSSTNNKHPSSKLNSKQLSSYTSTSSKILHKCREGMLQYDRHFLNKNAIIGNRLNKKASASASAVNSGKSSPQQNSLSSSSRSVLGGVSAVGGGWYGPKKGLQIVPELKSIQDLAKALISEDSTMKTFISSLFRQTNFHNLFNVEYQAGRLKVPRHLQKQASDMFSQYKKMNPHLIHNNNENENEDYPDVGHIESQHIVLSTNKITSDTSLFNELRKYRPGAMRHISAEEDAQIDAKYLEKEGPSKCDFCAKNKTAVDVFGRIVGDRCYTASNIAKVCQWHGLIINNNHHPLRMTREDVIDWLKVARQWFEKAHELDPEARFPHLMYDAGSRASASQPHLHLQTMLTKTGYFTHAKNLLDRAFQYSYCENGGFRDYFRDWIKAHEAVGLALHYQGSWLIVSLTPVHDKEIFIVGNSDSESFAILLQFAMRNVYVESKLQVRSFSMGMFFEQMGEQASFDFKKNNNFDDQSQQHQQDDSSIYPGSMTMPAVARLMDRGAPFDVRSDVGAMEFYGAFNVGTDPFFIMEQVKIAASEQGLLI